MPYAPSISRFLQPLAGAYPFGLASSEGRRLAAVDRFVGNEITFADGFDPIARLAAQLCDTPLAFCTLVGRDRIRLIGMHGLDTLRELPREPGLCATAIAQHVPYVVEQADVDARTKAHSLVAGPENIRFYVAVPLRSGRHSVGTLCVLDRVARHADGQAIEALEVLANLAVDRLERQAMLV